MGDNVTKEFDRSDNYSRFIIPFFINDPKNAIYKKVFTEDVWAKEQVSISYLAHYIKSMFGSSKDTEQIAFKYSLKTGTELFPLKLPANLSMKSRVVKYNNYNLTLKEITAYYFLTGGGFIVLEISHDKSESLENVTNKCFAFSQFMGANKTVKEGEDKRIIFTADIDGKEQEVELDKLVCKITKCEQFSQIELFPSFQRSRCNVYHCFLKSSKEDEDQKYQYLMMRGLLGDSDINSEMCENSMYKPMENMSMSIGTNGVSSLIYFDNEDSRKGKFHRTVLPTNIGKDYFLAYLLVLNEREVLLHYSFEAVGLWNNRKKLSAMRDRLVKFKVLFSYTTISEEDNYQNFYDFAAKVCKLDNLENDINEVIETVGDFTDSKHDQSINALLSCIGILAIFSALVDGFDLIDNLANANYWHGLSWAVLGIIVVVVLIGIIFWIKYRNEQK